MSIMKGALTARRYRISGEVPEEFRALYQEALQQHAFRESADATRITESAGWVEVHNLLDVAFTDFNRFLYDRYMVFGLRVDKKTLPAQLFRAHIEKREQAWCEAHGRTRCPAATKAEIKEQLEFEMLTKTLPRVAVTEVCWNIGEGWLLFNSLSSAPNERFRKLFFQTFGLKVFPCLPVDLVAERAMDQVSAMLRTAGTPFKAEVDR